MGLSAMSQLYGGTTGKQLALDLDAFLHQDEENSWFAKNFYHGCMHFIKCFFSCIIWDVYKFIFPFICSSVIVFKVRLGDEMLHVSFFATLE